MKYEKSQNEVSIFTALLIEKQVKRKQDELLLLNISFQALKDAKDKKYTLLVPKVSSLKVHEQRGEKKHTISFFRAEEKAKC
jgi:hypothetical protein